MKFSLSFLLVMSFFSFSCLSSGVFSLNKVDKEEQEGKLNPLQSKVHNYEFGISNKENRNHIYKISLNYLKCAKEWDTKKEMPKERKAAIGASFTWINLLTPSLIPNFEGDIYRLIKAKALDIEDLWLQGLPNIEILYPEIGKMQIIDDNVPLQFKSRMLSAFEGDNLFIGGTRGLGSNGTENPVKGF